MYRYVANRGHTATLNLEATPLSSKIVLNGHKAHQGILRLAPGNYNVVVTRSGFADGKSDVVVAEGETKYVGIILKSNDASTKNWYAAHPDDQKAFESITNKHYSADAKQQLKLEPFIKNLPFISAGNEFRIDYGNPAGSKASDKPTIYVSENYEEAKQDALLWIRSHGGDPSKMKLSYRPYAGGLTGPNQVPANSTQQNLNYTNQ